MPLNPQTVAFLLDNIETTHFHLYGTAVKQLMSYLSEEVSDNPVYNRYESEREHWGENFASRNKINIPNTFQQAKSFTYSLYKYFSENEDNYPQKFATWVFRQQHIPDGMDRLNDSVYRFLVAAIEDIIYANPALEIKTERPNNFQSIFVIHGHDEMLISEIKDLFQRSGIRTIILREQVSEGKHILDLFIKEALQVGYAIALFTPDDVTSDGNFRARQNVVLELGFFIGALGKDRVRMIVKPPIQMPSDMDGVLYEKWDHEGLWKQKLLSEVEAVGIRVRDN